MAFGEIAIEPILAKRRLRSLGRLQPMLSQGWWCMGRLMDAQSSYRSSALRPMGLRDCIESTNRPTELRKTGTGIESERSVYFRETSLSEVNGRGT